MEIRELLNIENVDLLNQFNIDKKPVVVERKKIISLYKMRMENQRLSAVEKEIKFKKVIILIENLDKLGKYDNLKLFILTGKNDSEIRCVFTDEKVEEILGII